MRNRPHGNTRILVSIRSSEKYGVVNTEIKRISKYRHAPMAGIPPFAHASRKKLTQLPLSAPLKLITHRQVPTTTTHHRQTRRA
jgi:hypothetical protein